jgi:predicted dehydrogenase
VGFYTPPGGRSDLIRRAIRAGKHVMATKPFDLDPQAAAAVLQEARQLGRVVHLNSPSPLWSPDLQQSRTWAQQHKLGRAISCRQSVYAAYREKADGGWYDDPSRCPVAPIFRLGIYGINDMVRLLGDASKVSALSSRIFTGRPTPDNAQASILFKNGAIGSIFASFCIQDGQHYANSLVVNYERGSVYRNTGPLGFGEAEGKSHMSVVAITDPKQTIIEKVTLTGGSGEYQWDIFAQAIRGEPLAEQVTPEQIVAGLKIITAMARSDAEQTIVSVD